MKKLQILMLALAIALSFPTLVLALPSSAPSRQTDCWVWDVHYDCLINIGCVFRATYLHYKVTCCLTYPPYDCETGTYRYFEHCGC